jgi:predicted alpha/beta-hydrolase family hydrolase
LEFLITGPDDAEHTIVLAHGAGAPMDSAVMDAACDALAAAGLKVVRFEFAYMAERRQGKRKPPPKAELLVAEYEKAASLLDVRTKPIIGGKSMGGRIASMIADPLYARGCIAGLLCLGYPFHPPKKPEQLRTAHLERLQVPTLIVQGTRDPFGTRDEVEGYALSASINMLWLEDGDHDLKPRKSVSGLTAADHLSRMATATQAWAGALEA